MAKVVKVTPLIQEAEFEEIPNQEIWEEDATLNDVVNDLKDHSQSTQNEETESSEIPQGEHSTKSENSGNSASTSGNAQTKSEPINSRLGGEFLLLLCDKSIPAALKLGIEFAAKNKRVDVRKLALDYEEKEMLRPSAEVTAQILFENLTPVQQFLLGLGVIYTGKLAEAVTDKDDK